MLFLHSVAWYRHETILVIPLQVLICYHSRHHSHWRQLMLSCRRGKWMFSSSEKQQWNNSFLVSLSPLFLCLQTHIEFCCNVIIGESAADSRVARRVQAVCYLKPKRKWSFLIYECTHITDIPDAVISISVAIQLIACLSVVVCL